MLKTGRSQMLTPLQPRHVATGKSQFENEQTTASHANSIRLMVVISLSYMAIHSGIE